MKRTLLFLALLIVFVVWSFPHDLVLETILRRELGKVNVAVAFGEVSLALRPLGYRVDDVSVRGERFDLALDRVYLGLRRRGSINLDADGCGGVLRGDVRDAGDEDTGVMASGRILEVTFARVDPGSCLQLDGLEVGGTFGGELVLADLGNGGRGGVLGGVSDAGHLLVEASGGLVSGHLPGPSGDRRPIGSWEFERLNVRAKLEQGVAAFDGSRATAEGVEWLVARSSVSSAGRGNVALDVEFRARSTDDSPRSKAVIGLLPKAGDKNGWRHYRVLGTATSPRLIGLK